MTYVRKGLKDIPAFLECPLCLDYSTKRKDHLICHLKKCESFDGEIDDIETYNIDDTTTLYECIEQQVQLVNTIKELVKSNALDQIKTQPLDDILAFIRTKALERIIIYDAIDYDCLRIYAFFFGHPEEWKRKFIEEAMKGLVPA